MRFPRLIAPLLLVPVTLAAQSPDTSGLRGRHMLIASLGLTGTREAVTSPTQTSARATGPLGALSYTHFVTPQAGFEIAVAVLDADASTSYANNRASAVTAFLVGLTFAPAALALGPTVRPFASAAIGAYGQHLSMVVSGSGSTQARSQSQAGGRLSAGVDFHVARYFAMRVVGDYHIVEPFDAVNGVQKDVSGLAASFGLAIAWGGARR